MLIEENVEKNNGILDDKDDFEEYPSLQEVKGFLDKIKNINVDIVDKNKYLLPLEIENLKLVVLGYLDEVDRLYSKVNHVIEEKPINQDLLKTLDERIGVVKKELLDVIEKHIRCNCNGKNCPTTFKVKVKEGGRTLDMAFEDTSIRATTPYNYAITDIVLTKDKDK